MHRGLPDPVEKGGSEGAAFSALARRSRRTPAAIVLVAIAVLAVALLTKAPTPAVGLPVPSGAPQPSLAAAANSSAVATVVASPAPIPGAPTRNPSVTPHPTFVAVPAKAGTTQLIPAGPTPVRVTIALPDGWKKASDAMYVKSDGVASAGMSIGAWKLDHVNIFPCRWSSQVFVDPDLMRTAQGQAEALSSWWGQDPLAPFGSNSKIAPIATKPRPATVGGHAAWYVEVLISSVFDFTQCDGGQFVFWNTANGDVRYGLGPGELDRLWVVDVEGELIVIDAASPLTASPAEGTELQAVIDSITIEP